MIKPGVAAATLLLTLIAGCGTRLGPAMTVSSPHATRSQPVTAYVATEYPDVVRPVRLATRMVLPPVRVRGGASVAVSPDGGTVVAVTYIGNDRTIVTLVRTATGKAFKSVRFTGFSFVWPVAFTPDSKTAYIVNDAWSGTVLPIQIRTGHLGRPIRVGHDPQGMAITPDGKTLYVANEESGTVTPIRTATNTTLRPIRVGKMPGAIVITPDGRAAYVDSETTDFVTKIRTATKTALKPIKAGRPAGYPDPGAIVITPDGKTVYRMGLGGVTPISVATNRARKEIPVGSESSGGLAITPDGKTVYAIDALFGVLTPIRTASNTALKKITIRQGIAAVAFTPDGRFMYIGSGGLLIPLRTATGKRGKAIRFRGLIIGLTIAP